MHALHARSWAKLQANGRMQRACWADQEKGSPAQPDSAPQKPEHKDGMPFSAGRKQSAAQGTTATAGLLPAVAVLHDAQIASHGRADPSPHALAHREIGGIAWISPSASITCHAGASSSKLGMVLRCSLPYARTAALTPPVPEPLDLWHHAIIRAQQASAPSTGSPEASIRRRADTHSGAP